MKPIRNLMTVASLNHRRQVHPSLRRLIVLGAVVTLTAACRPDDQATTAPLDVSEIIPVGFVQPVLVRMPGERPGEEEITVRVVGGQQTMGSYQGMITFDTTALTFVSLKVPEHDGEFRIVNSESAGSGRIRFAAFTAETLSDDIAFRFTVRTKGTWDAAALRAMLDVVGDSDGAALAEGALRQSAALRDGRTGAALTSSP
jgi:hypothetical protein